MNNPKINVLLITIIIGLGFPQINVAQQIPPDNIPQKTMTCDEALKNVSKIKVGMKDSEILDLLGTPTDISENTWSYNFFACAKPVIGSQIIAGVGIKFKEKVVREIGWATICTMGMPAPPPKKNKKKH